jgi:hypothetical protein
LSRTASRSQNHVCPKGVTVRKASPDLGSRQFTHAAYNDFRVVHDNLNGGNRTTKDRLVPFCIFTDPELARVGRNESERDTMELNTVWRRCRWPLCSAPGRFPNRAAS